MELQPERLLAEHTVLKCSDVQTFHAYIAGMDGRHERRVASDGPVDIELRHASLGRIDVGLQRCDTAMMVESARGRSATFLIQYPLSGSFVLEIDGRALSVVPGTGAVISPAQRVRRTAEPGWTLVFNVPGDFLRSRLEARLGRSVPCSIVFHPLIRAAAAEIFNYGLLMVEAIDRHVAESGSSLAEVLEVGFVDLLLMLQPHTQGETLARSEACERSHRIRTVTEYIDANLVRKLSVAQLANVAGCGVRSLQATFMELCGMSPTEYVRGRRLAMARQLLEAAGSDTTITGVAHQTGFSQPARFADYYKRAYGELPSETLQRAVSRDGEQEF
jgi:AraC-like DNA-binding protein